MFKPGEGKEGRKGKSHFWHDHKVFLCTATHITMEILYKVNVMAALKNLSNPNVVVWLKIVEMTLTILMDQLLGDTVKIL